MDSKAQYHRTGNLVSHLAIQVEIFGANLEVRVVFEGGIEIVDVVEVVDGVVWLSAHQLVFYHQIHDFSEIPCCFYSPGIEYEQGESSPFLQGELS